MLPVLRVGSIHTLDPSTLAPRHLESPNHCTRNQSHILELTTSEKATLMTAWDFWGPSRHSHNRNYEKDGFLRIFITLLLTYLFSAWGLMHTISNLRYSFKSVFPWQVKNQPEQGIPFLFEFAWWNWNKKLGRECIKNKKFDLWKYHESSMRCSGKMWQ